MLDLNLESMDSLLLISLILISLEIFLIPNLGLLFLGLGIFSTVGIIYLAPDTIDYLYFIIAILSVFWFIALWQPLKYFGNKSKSKHNFDIIGSNVQVVETDLAPGIIGKAMWSGTIMQAKLKDNINITVLVGSFLTVSEIKGNILILTNPQDKNPN